LEVGGIVFHLLISDGVCYLGFFDSRYPKTLAFTFLEEVHDLFREELKQTFGTGSVDHRSHIETIERPYYFVRFHGQILRKQAEFREPTSSKALSKLHGSSVQSSNVVGHISDVLDTAASFSNNGVGKAADAQLPSKFAAFVAIVLVVLVMGAVASQVCAYCAIALSCLATVLGMHCFSQLRGGGKSPKLKTAPDSFSCMADYMI